MVGSGLHHFSIAYFDPIAKKVVAFDYAHLNKDMLITENSGGGLSLYNAVINKMDSFVNLEVDKKDFISDIEYENGHISLSPVCKYIS